MQDLNRVILTGRLGQPPERRGENGPTTFSLAVTDRWKDADKQKHERTNWVNVVAWNGTGDNAFQYLKKGNRVLVEGALRVTTWEDKDSKEKRTGVEIVAERIIFLEKKPADSQLSLVEEPPAEPGRRKRA
jgi:single-strand DNA-binding protein